MVDVDAYRAARDPAWLAELLACPRCHSGLRSSAEGWSCERCGHVGRRTSGFPDFFAGASRLPMAGGDSMDLDRDAAAAVDVASGEPDFAELLARAAAVQAEGLGRDTWSSWRQRACTTSLERTSQLNLDTFAVGGEAFLAKVDAQLSDLGWPPLERRVALEAGGGHGFFLPSFASRFERVVFLDASLVNLVLAARLCADRGLANVAFVRGDVAAPPLASHRFDMVHENGVIEHVHSPGRMLSEAARLRSDRGYVVCVSPNRLTIVSEPHFGIPLYGALPRFLRRRVVPLLRGFDDGVGTDLLSLGRLRAELAGSLDGDEVTVFFVPRRLPFTARTTPARKAVKRALELPVVGSTLDRMLNRLLLGVAPQHIVLARRAATG